MSGHARGLRPRGTPGRLAMATDVMWPSACSEGVGVPKVRSFAGEYPACLFPCQRVGIVPHFTGPIAAAALVNYLSTFSGPVLMEYNHGGRPIDLPECLEFKNGKAYTNQRPGLGVTPDMSRLTIGEVTGPGRNNLSRTFLRERRFT